MGQTLLGPHARQGRLQQADHPTDRGRGPLVGHPDAHEPKSKCPQPGHAAPAVLSSLPSDTTTSRPATARMASTRSTSRELSARQTHAQAHADWLPQARPKLLMSDKRIKLFVENKMRHHWFLCFSMSLYEREDGNQGALVAKVYAFLYDHMPKGFTGRWAAIRGNDVMEILLCEKKELSVTRHKATSSAQANFESLEEWMRKGTNWREALSHTAGERKKANHKRGPVLYSPAGLAALLILSYPDPRYRRWVGRLQIDWMLTRRGKLEVTDGFWKGITDDNLGFFHAEEPRRAEVPLATDYDRLFGKDFTHARRDIRPFVPKLPENLFVTGDATDSEGLSEESSDAADDDEEESADGLDAEGDTSNGSITDVADAGHEVSELATLLRHDNTADAGELGAWLATALAAPENDVVREWTGCWTTRMVHASSYQEQVILQSLLLRSLGVLHRISSSPSCPVSAEAVMLLDMQDGRAPLRGLDPHKDAAARQRMRSLAACQQRVDAEKRLMEHALDQSRRDLLREAFDEYLAFLSDLFKAVSKHRHDVLKLDTLRTEVVLTGAAEKHGDVEPLDASLVRTLQLTTWQLRMLAVANLDTPGILTDWQAKVWHGMNGRGKTRDISQIKPVVAVDGPPFTEEQSRMVTEAGNYEVIRSLLGDLARPFALLHGDMSKSTPDCISVRGPSRSRSPPTCVNSAQSPPDTPPKVTTPATPARARVNPYIGRSVKRPCSPETRSVKRTAVGSTTSALEEAQRANEALREAVTASVTSCKDEILQHIEDKVTESSTGVKKRMSTKKRQLDDKV